MVEKAQPTRGYDFPWYEKQGGTLVPSEEPISKGSEFSTPTRYDVIESRYLVELIRENMQLQSEIRSLILALVEQNKNLTQLVSLIGAERKGITEEIISIRDIPREKAKKEIVELFQESETLYFSDIAERLRLDLELVVELCAELQKEGKIKLKD